MPKTTKQRIGEIVYALRGQKLITPTELRTVMGSVGVGCSTSRRDYERDLEALGYIRRIEGGWELTEQSKKDGIILIRVSPSQNREVVVKGLETALEQFKPLAIMEKVQS